MDGDRGSDADEDGGDGTDPTPDRADGAVEEETDDDGPAWWDEEDGDATARDDRSLERRFVAPLREAVREHSIYVAFSAGLFLLGAAIGAAMVGQVDLFATLGIEDPRQLFPENVTAATILINNTRAAILLVLGALSLGVVTALVLVFNGVLVGYVAGVAAAERGIGFVLLAILPHGVIELPAIFVAGAVAFRVVALTALRVVGRREVVLGRDGWRRTGLLLVATWFALVAAALVEFYVTTSILDAVAA